MNLWGMDISFKKEILALVEINEAFEEKIKENAIYFTNNRLQGKDITKVKKDENNSSFIPIKWARENIEYITTIMNNTRHCVEPILEKYEIDLQPNWDEMNAVGIKAQETFDSLLGEAIGDAFSMSAQEFQKVYTNAYNKSIIENSGMGFGILSSSAAAHLLYAAQAAAKEVKDKKRALEAASMAVENDPTALILTKMVQVLIPYYMDTLEPKMLEFLSMYYTMIHSFLRNGLNISDTEYESTIDKEKSNRVLNDCDNVNSAKKAIVEALRANPNNGNVIIPAINYGLIDESFLEYCRNASKNFSNEIETNIKSVMENNLHYVKMFNKPIINEKNNSLIDILKKYYSRLEYKEPQNCESWNHIINDIYSEIWDKVEKEIEIWINLLSDIKIKERLKNSSNSYVEGKKIIEEAKEICNGKEVQNLFYFANDFEYHTAINLLNKTHYSSKEDFDKSVNDLSNKIAKISKQIEAEKEEYERIESEKKLMRDQIQLQINTKKTELSKLGFALFGVNARVKKQLKYEISELEKKYRNI